jgi:hypothetical protein
LRKPTDVLIIKNTEHEFFTKKIRRPNRHGSLGALPFSLLFDAFFARFLGQKRQLHTRQRMLLQRWFRLGLPVSGVQRGGDLSRFEALPKGVRQAPDVGLFCFDVPRGFAPTACRKRPFSDLSGSTWTNRSAFHQLAELSSMPPKRLKNNHKKPFFFKKMKVQPFFKK